MCFCLKNTNSAAFSLDHFKREYNFDFKLIEDHKFFAISKCNECGTSWVLDKRSGNSYYSKIHSKYQIDLIKEWLKHDLSASHLVDIAKDIGSSSDDYYEVPCKAMLNDGKELDYCILSKWSFHPKISWYSIPITNYVYADQVKYIEPSEYSINLKNRNAMRNAKETIMRDLVPLIMIINKGTYFHDEGCKTYYFDSNFLKYNESKGRDVSEVNQDINNYKNFSEKENLKDKVTLILFDDFTKTHQKA